MSQIRNSANKPRNIINNILLSFNHAGGNRKNLIIEGKTDIKLFRNFIDENKIKIRTVNGKENIIRVMDGFPNSKKHLIYQTHIKNWVQ